MNARHLHVFALAILTSCPALALAQSKDATQSYNRATPGSSNIRNFTLRTTAANAIADARVRLSDDSTRVLTETGPITESRTSLRTLALAAGLIGRALRAGPPRPASTAERLENVPTRGLPLHAVMEIR